MPVPYSSRASRACSSLHPRQDAHHLVSTQHDWQAPTNSWTLKLRHPWQAHFQHLAAQEYQRRQGLLVSGRGQLSLVGKPDQKSLDLGRTQIPRVAQPVNADEGLAPMQVCLLGAPAVMQATDPLAHLIQQSRRRQGRHRIGRDELQCCARLRRTRASLWNSIVLAAARQSLNLCAADRAGTVSVTAAALRIDLVLHKTTVKRHFVQRH